MAVRLSLLALGAGLLVLATQLPAAPQIDSASTIRLAQTMGQTDPGEATAKPPKAKKARPKATGNGGAERKPAAPANSGPPDPGKYQ